jgi:hypothetical protein
MRVVIEKAGDSSAPLMADRKAGCIATMSAGIDTYDLIHLLADIARDNMHVNVGFGPAVGAEAF